MFKSIKTILWATLVVSLSFGFASCSDSDDDEEPGSIKVKRLPTKITRTRGNDVVRTWTFAYDAANRVTAVDKQNVIYDAEGRVIKIGGEDYKYNLKDGYVGNYSSSGGYFGRLLYIDDQSYLKSYKLNDGESSVELYDDKRNHLNHHYKNPFVDEMWTVNFNDFYSPFASANISRWVFLDERLYLLPSFATYAVGQNMPTDVKCRANESSSWVSFDTSFEVIKSEDNYPTEILEVFEKLSSTSKSLTTYTIEYKDAN